LEEKGLQRGCLTAGIHVYPAVFNHHRIALNGDRTGCTGRFSGGYFEAAGMERAFDQITINFAFRQGRLAVGAGVIGDVKISIEIIDRERHMVWWINATYVSRRQVLGTTQINHMR